MPAVSSMRLEVSQQKRRRSLGVNSGGHVGDVAPVALGQVEAIEPRPDRGFFNWSRSAIRTTWIRCVSSGGVDWRSASNGRMLASEGCAPSTSAAARRTNGSASLELARGQLGQRSGELGPVDQHFHAVDAQLAVGVGGAGQQRRVVQGAATLEHPEAVDSLARRRSGPHDRRAPRRRRLRRRGRQADWPPRFVPTRLGWPGRRPARRPTTWSDRSKVGAGAGLPSVPL